MAEKIKRDWFEEAFLKSRRPYFWIVLIGLLIYVQTLFFGFVDFDDKLLIVDNYDFLKDLSNVFRAFGQDVFSVSLYHSSKAYYRPLFIISLMLDAKLGGTSAFVYHFTNIVIHLLAVCLLFLFLLKLGYKRGPSLFCSVFFLSHPLLTQAVAWVPGRNDSLLTVFALLAFVFFLDFLKNKKRKYYLWHMLFFASALFTKESAVILILVCIFYLHFIKREGFFSHNKRVFAIGWFTVTVFWLLLRHNALRQSQVELTIFDIGRYLWANLPVFVGYAGKVFFPVNLAVLSTVKDINFSYGFSTAVLLGIFLFFSKEKRYEFIVFGFFWFFLFLLPSFIVPIFIGLEHRVYLALIGFIVVLLEIDMIKNLTVRKIKPLILCVSIIAVFSTITYSRSRDFKDTLSFWENAAGASPNSSLAHLNLGAKYCVYDLTDKAELEYRRALELNPRQPMAHNNLAIIYAGKNMVKEAEEEFKKELEINPLYADAYFNLGLLYYNHGRAEEAAQLWEETIKINPDYIKAYKNLAVYYYNSKDYRKAVNCVEELRKRDVIVRPELLKALNLQ